MSLCNTTSTGNYAIAQILRDSGFDADKCFSSTPGTDFPSQTESAFGFVLALSANGCVLAVAASRYDVLDAQGNEATDAGAVFVFERRKEFSVCKGRRRRPKASNYIFREQLTAEEPTSLLNFGSSLAISGDGNRICVGSPNEPLSDGEMPDTGLVYVFDRKPNESGFCRRPLVTWSVVQKVRAKTVQNTTTERCNKGGLVVRDTGFGSFGRALALSRDGRVLLVNASGPNRADLSERVYFYELPCTSATFAFRQRILSSEVSLAQSDGFGASLALTASGNTAIIGAPSSMAFPSFSRAGEVLVFKRCQERLWWTRCQTLESSDIASNSAFGTNVDVTPDGGYVIVWAPSKFKQEDGGSPSDVVKGVVSVYARNNKKNTRYSLVDTLCPKPTRDIDFAGLSLGDAVAMSDDGQTIAVGYYVSTSGVAPSLFDDGALVVFERLRAKNEWTQKQVITIEALRKPPNSFPPVVEGDIEGTYLGIGLVMSGDGRTMVAGGGPGENSTVANDMAFILERRHRRPER